MKDRIAKIIKKEQLTSQQFAEIIEIQSSTISHILAGRNLPSFKIIFNLLERFPKISPDWLIFGKGEMYRDVEKHISAPGIEEGFDEIEDVFTKSRGNVDFLYTGGEIQPFLSESNKTIIDEDYIIEDRKPLAQHNEPIQAEIAVNTGVNSINNINIEDSDKSKDIKEMSPINDRNNKPLDKIIDKIIIMYCDKTFEIFDPK